MNSLSEVLLPRKTPVMREPALLASNGLVSGTLKGLKSRYRGPENGIHGASLKLTRSM